MPILIAAATAISLTVLSCLVQYEILGRTAERMSCGSVTGRLQVLISVAAIFTSHLVSVALYAIAYFLMHVHLPGARLAGEFEGEAIDFIYFSIMSYTTLGVGDIYPEGLMRIVSGLQAVTGFVMLGWSTSFVYWAVSRSSKGE